MSIFTKLGRKQMQALGGYATSGVFYGATGVCLLSYFTEWRYVLQYLPYYNGKYGPIEE